jgi:hypothetical protein
VRRAEDRGEAPPPVIFTPNHHSHVDTGLMVRAVPAAWRRHLVTAAAADYFFGRRWKARLAALRRTPEQLARLHEALAERTALIGLPGYEDADIAFHQALLDATGNSLLAELYRGVGGNERALHALRDEAAVSADGEARPTDIDEAHAPIVEAVAAGDPVAAAAAAEAAVRLINERQGIHLPGYDATGADR